MLVPALAIAAIGSFVAGTIAVLGLMFVAPPLASVALAFQSPEYVALVILGLTFLSYVSMGSTARAMMMAAAGLLLGTVGNDPVGGVDRFMFGLSDLGDGFGLVPVVVGLFGVSEILVNLYKKDGISSFTTKIGRLLPSREDLARSVMPILRGSGIGFLIGLLPGGNAIMAAILSYAIERRVSDTPERFGNGAIEGVAGPEAANNAASISCFVPVLDAGRANQRDHGTAAGGTDDPRRAARTAADQPQSGVVLGHDRKHAHRQRNAADPQSSAGRALGAFAARPVQLSVSRWCCCSACWALTRWAIPRSICSS